MGGNALPVQALAILIAGDDDIMNNLLRLIEREAGFLRRNPLAVRLRRNRPRNENYYERIVPRFQDDLFKEHFRMSRASFQELVNVIGNAMVGNRDRFIELPKKVMVTVWILAKQESFLAVGDRFGVAKSSCHYVLREIIRILKNLIPTYIVWPERRTLLDNANAFRVKSHGFPGVVAAIDGCHVQCRQPPQNANDYYNRKGTHSLILQGVCDHRTLFLDVFIGLPGRMHDAHVFRLSPMYDHLTSDVYPLLPPDLHLIGDSAYPLLLNVMTPFRDTGHLSPRQTHFNTKLSSIRVAIERAFGFLKNKFRRLKYLDIQDIDLGCDMIAASCVLHNFLIQRDEIDVNNEIMDGDNIGDHNVRNDNEGNLPEAVAKRNNIMAMLG